MTNKEYNGWYNYETWVVNLWMSNEQPSSEYWREQARFLLSDTGLAAHRPRYIASYTDDEVAIAALEEQLKSEHEEMLPELDGFVADLLGGAMSEVNWREIARHWVEAEKQEMENA